MDDDASRSLPDAPGPSLTQDEAKLQDYAEHLAAAFEAVAERWLLGLVADRAPHVAADPGVRSRIQAAALEVVSQVRALLATDISDQRMGPLQLLRRCVQGVPTDELARAGVPQPPRDEFAVRNFPRDIYDLSPASFGDVDPSLHEPGLVWGAAKAHVHLRRRRDG